jgi:prophage antirepressor-like protein
MKMNNEIRIFENEQFGKVRTLLIDGQPWFVGKDVGKALG